MDYIIKPYNCLCELEEFSINNIKADYNDFGSKEDINRAAAAPYGCGNMRFTPEEYPSDKVLEKYNITEDEYDLICMKLVKALSFGHCGWCI